MRILPGVGFGLATVLLTWPLACASGQAVSIRDDYLVELWNFWWVGTALFDRGVSPYWTDMLHFPSGISLARHTLAMANSLPGAVLTRLLDPDAAYRTVLLLHFWLSAWVFFLLARELTGSTRGALLAGLLWSFGPYHACYVPQLNKASLEGIPLSALFTVLSYRRGGWHSALGLGLSTLLLAASDAYYLVYAALLCGLLVAAGRLWDPDTRWRDGLRRVAWAALPALAGAALGAWPLLSDALSGAGPPALAKLQAHRSNDLLGYLWVGPPERMLVAWPAFLGYTTLALLLLGRRAVGRQRFWLLAGALFFLLGLGPELRVGGTATGIPLPYGLLQDLPVLSMLRKPDRFALPMLLCVAVLAAFAWRDLESRLPTGATRWGVWAGLAALLCLELSPAPLRTFPVETPPHVRWIAADESSRALVEVPFFSVAPHAARSNREQIDHGKAIAGGYVTSLAFGASPQREAEAWQGVIRRLDGGDGSPLLERMQETGTDLVVLRKTRPGMRRDRRRSPGSWLPFAFQRRDLIEIRQIGHLVRRPEDETVLRGRSQALGASFGAPAYEDERVAIYRRP